MSDICELIEEVSISDSSLVAAADVAKTMEILREIFPWWWRIQVVESASVLEMTGEADQPKNNRKQSTAA